MNRKMKCTVCDEVNEFIDDDIRFGCDHDMVYLKPIMKYSMLR
jgi:hypothetical protein